MLSNIHLSCIKSVVLPHGSGAQMPPRPSSVQSDGSLHPAMSQSPMAQDRGVFKSKALDRTNQFKKASHALLFFLSASPQGLCRETHRCLLTAPLSLPLLCPHASPQGDKCILGWAHINRTTPWVAMDSKGDNMGPKVLLC